MPEKPTYEELELRIRELERGPLCFDGTIVSESAYRLMLESISDTVIVTDDQGELLYVCPNTFEIFGLSQDKIYSYQHIQVLMNGSVCEISNLKSKGELRNIEWSIQNSDGQRRYLSVSAKSVNIGEGTVLYVMKDITDKKLSEKKLSESETRFRHISSLSPGGIYETDINGDCIYANQAWLKMAGMTMEAAKGKGWIKGLHPDDREYIGQSWYGMVESEGKWGIEYRFQDDQGLVTWVYGTATSIKDGKGNITGYLGYNFPITERKIADEKLKKLSKRLQQALLIAKLGHWDWEMSTGELNWSDEVFQIFGRDKKTFQPAAESFEACIHPDDYKSFIKERDSALKENRYIDIEHRIILPDESIRHVQELAEIIRDKNDDIIRVSGVVQDITDHKIAEEALRFSEKKYRDLFESNIDGIILTDVDGVINEVNPAFLKMVGYDNFDELKKTYQELTPEKWHGIEADIVKNQVFTRGYSDEYEKEYIRKDGTVFPISIKVWLVKDQDNPVSLWGIVRDITERKKAETALRESEERFRLAFMTSPDSININRLEDGLYLDINEGFTQIMGYERNDVIGKTSLSLNIWKNPEDRKKMIEGLGAKGFVENLEAAFVGKDGQIRYGLMSARKITLKNEEAILSITRDITERRQAELTLKQEKERAQRYLDLAGTIFIAINAEGIVTLVNQKGCRVLGYNEKEIIGKNWFENFIPDWLRKDLLPISRQLLNGEITPFEYYENPVLTKSGEERMIAWHNTILKDAGGKITGHLSSGEDITDRKRAERELSKAQTIQIALAEHLPAGMMMVDVSTRKIESVNVYAASLFGADMDDIVGHKCHKFICPASEGMCPICDLGQTIDNKEREIVLKDGGRVPVLKSVVSIVIDEKEKLLEYFIDISDRKKAEIELRESEEKYRKLVTTAPYGIQLTDREGKIIFSNPAHHKIQGYDNGELLGKYIWELMADDTHRSDAKRYYQRLIKDQPQPEVYFNRDLTKDGREIDVQINWEYIRNSKGDVEGIISIISDITRQKALESKLQQAQKMESIGNLAGGIAHDFNNILFPIIGMSEILLEDLPSGSIERENAEQIFKAGKRGGDLVKQILAFSRQSEHKLTPTSLQNIIKEVIKLSRASIPAYIEINYEIQEDCGLVMADPSQIHQIGMNIITNAYHAVEDTSGKIFIRLRQALIDETESIKINLSPGGYAVLSILDTGHGMSKELMGKIFDPYFTTKEQGKGTGLGLAVVYGIVKEHRGEIKVYSELGKGSTFDIYFPLIQKNDRIESVHTSEAYQGGNERILLVDDEESIAKLEKQMLERMGYKVTCHVNSVEALEAFRASPLSFDLVISDMSMPNIPGDELAREIKSIRSDIPIVICTGFSERIRDEENIKELGIDGLLMKPVVKSDLAKVVRRLFETSVK